MNMFIIQPGHRMEALDIFYYFGIDSVYNHYTYYPIVFQSLREE